VNSCNETLGTRVTRPYEFESLFSLVHGCELLEIMECQSNPVQTTYPVFYDVEPTEALKEAANLAGWKLKKTVNGYVIADYIAPMLFESCQMNRDWRWWENIFATAIFNKISDHFEGSSFVENVREVSKTSLSGLKELQKQILTDIFSVQYITASSVSGGINKMVQLIHRKKVLVLLDNVNDTKQLEA
nr:Toll/interleukin-1 receptor (TIR) domain-containing protein [Tanacetum cinerariifolium]